MIPVVTPREMARIDAAASVPTDALIERAGGAVANEAYHLLARLADRRPTERPAVLVVAGSGNNGEDGRTAATLLTKRRVDCEVIAPADLAAPQTQRKLADDTYRLIIDAAYGTGLNRAWHPLAQPAAPVLAVDVPSGIEGLTGRDLGSWRAELTVTFGALKGAHVFYPGAARCGEVRLDSIGLDVADAGARLLTDASAHEHLPTIERTAHKWQRAVRVVAGSAQYSGAGWLASAAALRAGAGAVVASCPGTEARDVERPVEVVGRSLSADDWAIEVLDGIDRFGALLIGPGLGREPSTLEQVRLLVANCPIPLVVDADGLAAIAERPEVMSERAQRHSPGTPAVLTPHAGEWTELMGRTPDADLLAEVRSSATKFNATVLLKGPATVVAPPTAQGVAHIATAGNQRLATAGSGDVLSGVIASCVAGLRAHQLADPNYFGAAVASAAHWHGRTATYQTHRGPTFAVVSHTSGDTDAVPTHRGRLPARGREHVFTPLVATDQVAALADARQVIADASSLGTQARAKQNDE